MVESYIPILILGVIGFGCVVWSLQLILTAEDSSSWKAVDAHLVEARVVMQPVKVRSGAIRVTVKEVYHVEVRYAYTVNGQSYTGNRFKIGQTRLGVDSHQDGARVTSVFKTTPTFDVYYDPKRPELAVLQRGGNSSRILGMLALGLGFVVLSIGLFLASRGKL